MKSFNSKIDVLAHSMKKETLLPEVTPDTPRARQLSWKFVAGSRPFRHRRAVQHDAAGPPVCPAFGRPPHGDAGVSFRLRIAQGEDGVGEGRIVDGTAAAQARPTSPSPPSLVYLP